MKLLLDQHLSYKLVDRLADVFPGTAQVRLLHLEKASDSEVWYYARTHGYVVVTKDSDMVNLAFLRGAPPKIVWLRLGNVGTAGLEEILRQHRSAIEELGEDTSRTILEIIA